MGSKVYWGSNLVTSIACHLGVCVGGYFGLNRWQIFLREHLPRTAETAEQEEYLGLALCLSRAR